ncbi:aquaporin-like protein [Teratosphaeria nubilosa]|uniref:Aquaporin-like protein n=1 Tax=Teratosphaeria nubilosa TaxID=161662 RepID=A0A6G1L9U7_9PEZI|nr:aquaporin-like protein [Teratosphaeria nubilosa]
MPHNVLARFRLKYHRPLAEWLGTTIAMFIGISANLAVVTSSEQAATYQTMYFAWGFAIMLGIYVAGGGSGAFLNPAITIMLSVLRGFPAKRIPSYICVQILGAFIGALLAFAIYYDNIIHLDGGLKPESTGIMFYTQPKSWESAATAFFTEFLGSMILGCCILALGDSGNSPPGAGMHAFIIGLLITCCLMCFSYSTGGCFNGARDLGPRMAAMAVGYPTSIFTEFDNWWIWGPWGATITGSLVGGLVYDICVFRGNESPVNFSLRRFKYEGRKVECTWLKWFRQEKRAKNVERDVEDGLGGPGSDEEMGRR